MVAGAVAAAPSTQPAAGGPGTPGTPVAGPTAGPGPAPGQVTALPEVIIERSRFEGKDVARTVLSIQGISLLEPRASSGDQDDTVVTIDDIVSLQIDLKVTGVAYKTSKDGTITRIAHVRPVQNIPVTVTDVIRDRDTRVR